LTTIPARAMKSAKQKPPSSYSVAHASKAKPKVANESVGKMTKFRSLDDIPDATSDFDWGSSAIAPQQEDYFQEDHSFDEYRIKSVKLESPVGKGNSGPSATSNTAAGKVPPLPYDQSRAAIAKPSASLNNNAPVPATKYFDYDDGDDDFESDQISLPTPSPKKALRLGEAGAKQGAAAVPMPAPPLPCDTKPNNSEADTIYYSKKPRPVEFKYVHATNECVASTNVPNDAGVSTPVFADRTR
jgi:hypothetical protein